MVKIEILDTTLNIPAHLKDASDRILLDLPADFALRLTRSLEELTDVNEIKIDGVLGVSIPKTDKNWLVFKHRLLPDVSDIDFTPLEANVWVGSHVIRQNLIYVIKDSQNAIEIEIRDGSNHWITYSRSRYLNTVDYGSFTFTEANVTANQAGQSSYADGQIGIWFPDAWYGRLFNYRQVNLVDYRPFHHALSIMQKALNQGGWNFDCPALESTVGRRLGSYILDQDFSKDDTLLEQRQFKATLDAPLEMDLGSVFVDPGDNGSKIIFDVEIYDNDENYDNTTGIYQGAIIGDFIVEMDIFMKINNAFLDNTRSSVRINLIIERPGEVPEYLDTYEKKTKNFKGTEQLTLVSNIFASPLDKIYVNIEWGGDDIEKIEIQAGAVFYNDPEDTVFQEGDDIDLATIIDPDYDLLSYFKGLAHYFNFKLVTNFTTRTLSALTPFDGDFHGDSLAGFFKNSGSDVVEINQFIQKKSEITESPSSKIDRYHRLAFKSSTDPAIKDLNLKKDEPLYFHTHDLGDQYREKTKKRENPFFEPTLNKATQNYDAGGVPVDLPWLTDNNNGELSFNIGPRLLYFHGSTQQHVLDNEIEPTDSSSLSIAKFGVITPFIMYAYQKGNAILNFSPFPTPILTTVAIVYGEDDNSAFNLFYKDWFNLFIGRLKLSLLVMLSHEDFLMWSFRDVYWFDYYGRKITGRLSEIRDFDTEKQLTTPITFAPEPQSLSVLGIVPLPPTCANNPTIEVSISAGPCYDLSQGGVLESIPAVTTWSWRYHDIITWTVLGSPQICNPTREFVVRQHMTYTDGCPSTTRQIYLDPCNNNPVINFELGVSANNTPILTITITGNTSPLAALNPVITYTIDGGPSLPYTVPLENVLGLIEVTASNDYSDDCETKVVVDDIFIDSFSPPPYVPPGQVSGIWMTQEHLAVTGLVLAIPETDGAWGDAITLPDPAVVDLLYLRKNVIVEVNGAVQLHKMPAAATKGNEYEIDRTGVQNDIVFAKALPFAKEVIIRVFVPTMSE